jgi:hypothetical protein
MHLIFSSVWKSCICYKLIKILTKSNIHKRDAGEKPFTCTNRDHLHVPTERNHLHVPTERETIYMYQQRDYLHVSTGIDHLHVPAFGQRLNLQIRFITDYTLNLPILCGFAHGTRKKKSVDAVNVWCDGGIGTNTFNCKFSRIRSVITFLTMKNKSCHLGRLSRKKNELMYFNFKKLVIYGLSLVYCSLITKDLSQNHILRIFFKKLIHSRCLIFQWKTELLWKPI